MYTRIFVLASLFTSLVAGVDIPGLPACAGDCVPDDFGGCQRLNVDCICTNKPLLTNLACCVSKKCDEDDQDKTIQFANAICAGENVSDLPQSATCASTATGSSSSASSTSGSSNGSSSGSSSTTGTGTVAAGQTTSTGVGAAPTRSVQVGSSSSAGAAPTHGIGLGMVVAGLVAAI